MFSSAIIKNENQIEHIRQSAEILSEAMGVIAEHINLETPLVELSKVAEDFIRSKNAKPAFLNYSGFPLSACISLNEVVVHGIPAPNTVVKEGDVLSIDCGVNLGGYFSDMAYTFRIGAVSDEVDKLVSHTKESLYKGIDEIRHGKYVGDIGYAIENYISEFGYGVVRDLVGHGVGLKLHEKPEVPNYGKRGTGKKLKKGMVLAIEPMINLGTYKVEIASDQWTINTLDKKPSAHFEHTVLVTSGKAEILSSYKYIEKAIQSNENIS